MEEPGRFNSIVADFACGKASYLLYIEHGLRLAEQGYVEDGLRLAPAPPTPAERGLPPGWSAHLAPPGHQNAGMTYYHHEASGVRSWKRPEPEPERPL